MRGGMGVVCVRGVMRGECDGCGECEGCVDK